MRALGRADSAAALSDNLIYLSLILGLFAANYTAIQPMGDSVILESLQERRQPFGPMRLLGTYSFAVASILIGRLFDGHPERMPWTTALILGLTFLSTYGLPSAAGHAREKGGAKMAELFKDKKLMLLIALVTLLQTTLGYFYVFFPVHFTSLPGGSSALLGWAYFISAASETPFLIFSDRLFERIGVGKLLLISAASLALRWLILALTDSVWVALASQLLHGWGFIVMTVTMAKYISLTVPPRWRAGPDAAGGQRFGVARVAGNLGGGYIAQASATRPRSADAALALVSLIAFAPAYWKREPLNGLS